MNKLNKEKEAPLYLRITKDRKSKFISLGEYIKPMYWNKKACEVKPGHPNSEWLNNFIEHKKAEAREISLKKQSESKYVPTKSIKEAILGKSSESFFEFAERYITGIERKKIEGFDYIYSALFDEKTQAEAAPKTASRLHRGLRR